MEALEARLVFDAAVTDSSAYTTVEEPAEEVMRFFLSERGIGEGPLVENPTIEMELGGSKTLYVWMQVPDGVSLLTVGLNLVSATPGVVTTIESNVYEPVKGSRWAGVRRPWYEWGAVGDMLAEFGAATISPVNYSSPVVRASDPSYDVSSGAYLFGSVTITASGIGESDLHFEVSQLKTVARGRPGQGLPMHFGVGDETVLGNVVYATSSHADGRVVVGTSAEQIAPTEDEYEFVAFSGSAHEVSAVEGVLANDELPQGTTVELVSATRFGSVELAVDGGFRYVAPIVSELPRANRDVHFFPDVFVYRVVTPEGDSALARVSIRLTAGLAASDDFLALDVRSQPYLPLGWEIISNDRWFTQNFRPHELEIVAPPENGEITYLTGGFGEYVPNLGFRGRDQFSYRYSDGVNSTTGTVYVDVTFENQAPQATDDEVWVRNSPYATISPELLLNDVDPDGDELRWAAVRIIDPPQHGTVWKSPGNIHYHPVAGFTGTDALTYVVDDGLEASNVATVIIHVTISPNEVPSNENTEELPEKPNGEIAVEPGDGNSPDTFRDPLESPVDDPLGGVRPPAGIGIGAIYVPEIAHVLPVGDVLFLGISGSDAVRLLDEDVPMAIHHGLLAEVVGARPASRRVMAQRRVAMDAATVDWHFAGLSHLAVGSDRERQDTRRMRRR